MQSRTHKVRPALLTKHLRTTLQDKAQHSDRVGKPQPIEKGSGTLEYLRGLSSRVSGKYEAAVPLS